MQNMPPIPYVLPILRVGWSIGRVNCCWSSPAESFLVQGPAELITIFFCFKALGVVQLLLCDVEISLFCTFVYMFCKREIYHRHYTISGYHSNEFSSINTLYRRMLCTKSWKSEKSFACVCCVYALTWVLATQWNLTNPEFAIIRTLVSAHYDLDDHITWISDRKLPHVALA
jgi:hypothetical protein